MTDIGQYWNPRQAQLKQALKEKNIEEAKALLYELHSAVHSSEVYQISTPSYMDEIWDGLTVKAFRTMPTKKDVTIAWNIWHITRIEDITANILIENSNQVLNDEWLTKLNISVKDTGNAMTDDEITAFSNNMSCEELRRYRNSVGLKTKQVIDNLKQEDLKHKFSKNQLNRILSEGGVTENPESIWLLDFWGKKNVAGILLMPITRHQIVHLNDCVKLKSKCSKKHTTESNKRVNR